MRTIIKEIDLYPFDELSKDIQEKVIERYREWNVSDLDWSESTIIYWEEKLAEIGFEDAKIYWRGFWSQGDGAFFEARCNTEKLLNTLIYCEVRKTPRFGVEKSWKYERALAYNEAFGINIGIIRSNFRYDHDNCGYVSCQFDVTNMSKKMYREEEILADDINELRRDLCQTIYSDLQKEYEYLTSDDCIVDMIKAHELEFTITGDRYQ